MISQLTETYLKDITYVQKLAPKTVHSYGQALRAFAPLLPGELSTEALREAVIALRARLATGGLNVYIRAMNAFLHWAHNQGHTKTWLKVKLLKTEKTELATLKGRIPLNSSSRWDGRSSEIGTDREPRLSGDDNHSKHHCEDHDGRHGSCILTTTGEPKGNKATVSFKDGWVVDELCVVVLAEHMHDAQTSMI